MRCILIGAGPLEAQRAPSAGTERNLEERWAAGAAGAAGEELRIRWGVVEMVATALFLEALVAAEARALMIPPGPIPAARAGRELMELWWS